MNNMRWFWRLIKKSKWAFFCGCSILIFEIIAKMSQIGLQKWLIDTVFMNGKYELLPKMLLLIGLAYLGASIFPYWAGWILHKIGYKVRVMVAEKLMAAVHKLPIHIFQNERVTRYVDYFTNDVEAIGEYVYRMPLSLQEVLRALFLLAVIAVINPFTLLVVTIMSCLYLVIGKYFKKRVKNKVKEVRDSRTDLLIHIEEGISSTREVIAYDRMNWESKIYDSLFKKYYTKILQEVKLTNTQMFLTAPVRWGSNIFVLIYGGYCVLNKNMTLGTFLILYQYSSQLVTSLQALYDFNVSLSSLDVSIDRVRLVIDGAAINEGTLPLKEKLSTIRFEDVSFNYSENSAPILDNLCIDIPVGKKIALVGSSGSGKSTISRLLIRFFEPSSGKILINGIPLNDIKLSAWKESYNIAFQEPYLFPDSIRNNIVFGRENISQEHLENICKQVLIHDYIKELENGYETQVGERGITLSGGQKQRLSLARAILSDPEILILDEATSALDLETERQIQKNIDELRIGKTTIIIAHRLSTVQNADIIYVLENGKIIESGAHAELMEKDSAYRQLVYAQAEV